MTTFDSERYAKRLAREKGISIPESTHIPPVTLPTNYDAFCRERERLLRLYEAVIETDSELAEFYVQSFLFTTWNKQPGDIEFITPGYNPSTREK